MKIITARVNFKHSKLPSLVEYAVPEEYEREIEEVLYNNFGITVFSEVGPGKLSGYTVDIRNKFKNGA